MASTIVSLTADHATENYPSFLDSVRTYASTQTHGGLERVLEDESLMVKKPEVPLECKGAALKIYEIRDKEYENCRNGIVAIRKEVISALDQDIRSTLIAQREGGLASMTLWDIMEQLKYRYGKADDAVLIQVHARINASWTLARGSFSKFISALRADYAVLAHNGQTISEFDKQNKLAQALKGEPAYTAVVQDYKRVCTLREKTFEDMVEYIKEHAHVVTPEAVGYIGNVTAAPSTAANTPAELAQAIAPLLIKHFAGLATSSGAARGNRPAGRDGRGRGRLQTGRGGRNNDKYCFVHGYNRTHPGTECLVMVNDPSYTDSMKQATAPCTIGGYCGRN